MTCGFFNLLEKIWTLAFCSTDRGSTCTYKYTPSSLFLSLWMLQRKKGSILCLRLWTSAGMFHSPVVSRRNISRNKFFLLLAALTTSFPVTHRYVSVSISYPVSHFIQIFILLPIKREEEFIACTVLKCYITFK